MTHALTDWSEPGGCGMKCAGRRDYARLAPLNRMGLLVLRGFRGIAVVLVIVCVYQLPARH
jgi:hypothetical protein